MPISASLSYPLPGLTATLDKLVYHHGGVSFPEDKPHAFVYFVTIDNASSQTVTLLGRKWIIDQVDGERIVVEGDRIVGETPCLTPGDQFSYNSYHITSISARVSGIFYGVDNCGNKVHVMLSPFEMRIP